MGHLLTLDDEPLSWEELHRRNEEWWARQGFGFSEEVRSQARRDVMRADEARAMRGGATRWTGRRRWSR